MPRSFSGEKTSFLTNGALKTGYPHKKNNKVDPCLTPNIGKIFTI